MSAQTTLDSKPVFGPPRPPNLVNASENYLLRVQLELGSNVNTPITRTISCPGNATFHQLHRALQIAFGWATTHTYDFKVKDPDVDYNAEEDIVTIIQKRMQYDSSSGKAGFGPKLLLRLVEARATQPSAMGPGFPSIDMMHDGARKNPLTTQRMSHKVRLRDVFEDARYRGQKMEYGYDFGDNWEHDIKVVGRLPATTRFEVVDGEGHGAAEDVGSLRGWEELIKAYNTRSPSKEEKEKISWYENKCSNGDRQGLRGYRAKVWNKEAVEAMLEADASINGI